MQSPTLVEMASSVPPPAWLVEMHEHYGKFGFYRPGDIVRMLGDQTKGVECPSSEADIKAHFGIRNSAREHGGQA